MLLLARHGQTPYNADRRYQGQAPIALSALGQQQAHDLARHAKRGRKIASLWASPLPRARRTADAVAAALGLEVREHPGVMEHDTGEWTHQLMDDVAATQPELHAAYHATDPDFAFPGGESLRDFQGRCLEALAEIEASGPSPALVVCHRGVVRVTRCHEDPRGLASFMEHDIANGDIAEL